MRPTPARTTLTVRADPSDAGWLHSVLRDEIGLPAATPERQQAPAATLDSDLQQILDTEFAEAARPQVRSMLG